MDLPFSLTSEIRENRLIIATSGYINNIGGEAIAQEFNRHLIGGHKHIVLNLAESKVINSVGMSYLLEILEKLEEVNGKLVITNLDPAVDKMLTIMGIFQFAGKASDVAEALKSFA